jgi:hypothetical protein
MFSRHRRLNICCLTPLLPLQVQVECSGDRRQESDLVVVADRLSN